MWVHLIIVGVVILDQVTKLMVQWRFDLHASIPVIPGLFSLTYIQNRGAAYGIFHGQRWFLVAVSVGMLLFLVGARRQFITEGRLSRVAFGLMCAGIVGNLIDRLRQGYVIDFLDFYIKNSHFPAFNVADSAICTGVGLFMMVQFLVWRRERAAATPL